MCTAVVASAYNCLAGLAYNAPGAFDQPRVVAVLRDILLKKLVVAREKWVETLLLGHLRLSVDSLSMKIGTPIGPLESAIVYDDHNKNSIIIIIIIIETTPTETI